MKSAVHQLWTKPQSVLMQHLLNWNNSVSKYFFAKVDKSTAVLVSALMKIETS